MQAVADPQLLEVAEPGIETGERGLRIAVEIEPAILGQPRVPRPLEYRARENAGPAGIERDGLGIFVQQRLDLGRGAMQSGLGQRRGQVPDRDRRDAPLGLGRLARIVDDEGIDDRHGAEHRLRRAGRRQRHRLAGQPFERAVSAEMDHGIDCFAMAQPQVEGEVGVAGRPAGVVVVGLAVRGRPPVGLHGDDHAPGAQDA